MLTAAAPIPGPVDVSRYVLIVGNNLSSDASLAALRYADDDAVLYRRLFEPFAEQVILLSGLDDETQQRYPNEAAQTRLPTRAGLQDALSEVFSAMEEAKEKGAERVDLIFVFVGHGGVDDEGKGFVHLSDATFSRADLFSQVLAASPADTTHVIVDACNAYSLVAGRGDEESAEQRAFDSFLAGNDLEAFPNVGVLVATSDERETHEWSRIRAGVFSHQVRSGLAGAADINHDGRIEYSEMAAFVESANAGLSGLGKRMTTFAWPPTKNRRAELLRIGEAEGIRHLVIGEELAGRFYLESQADERWAELHKPAGEWVALALPAGMPFFLRDGDHEMSINAGGTVVRVGSRPQQASAVSERGAVDHAFEAGLFAVPFGIHYYRGYVSARKELMAVRPATDGFLLQASDKDTPSVVSDSDAAVASAGETPREMRFELGYGLAEALLNSRTRLANGLYLRISRPLSSRLWVTGQLDGDFARLRYKAEIDLIRFGLFGGVAYRQPLVGSVEALAGVELGWGGAILTSNGGTDPTMPSARVRVGVGGDLLAGWGWSVAATLSEYFLTLDDNDTLRGRVGFQAGITW